jgi:hypothetical protein
MSTQRWIALSTGIIVTAIIYHRHVAQGTSANSSVLCRRAPVSIDGAIEEKQLAPLTLLHRGRDTVEQEAGGNFRLAELAPALQTAEGDPKRVFQNLVRSLFHV